MQNVCASCCKQQEGLLIVFISNYILGMESFLASWFYKTWFQKEGCLQVLQDHLCSSGVYSVNKQVT